MFSASGFTELFCCYNDYFTWQEADPSSDSCFNCLMIVLRRSVFGQVKNHGFCNFRNRILVDPC